MINPAIGDVLSSFKEIALVSDEVRCKHIINGLASGMNIETFTNQLATFVSQSEENAFYISSTLRKALLADSKIVCTLMGRIMADNISDRKSYDRDDVIIIRALESATDDDIIVFRKIMQTLDDDTVTLESEDYVGCIDWGLSNRLFKQEDKGFQGTTLMLGYDTKVCNASRKLMIYTEEIKQLFRYID